MSDQGIPENDDQVPDMDQNLIDSILGFSKTALPDDQIGARALLDTTAVRHERVPMLESAFERIVRALKTYLRKMASDDVEVTLYEVTSTRFGPYLTSVSLPAMLAIAKADIWNGPFIVTVSAGLVFSLLELTLGAGTLNEKTPLEGRGFTTIETGIARVLFEAILSSAEEAFSTISKVDFSIERFETSPRFAAIAPPATLAALAKFRIEMGGIAGDFDIAIPYLALEPVRHLLLTNYSGDRLGNDEIWASHLAAQTAVSETRLSAVLFEGKMPLAKLSALGVGDTLIFPVKPTDPIDLRCEDVVLARGHLGRLDRNVAVRIDNLQGMKP